jgi:hypothetical protein
MADNLSWRLLFIVVGGLLTTAQHVDLGRGERTGVPITVVTRTDIWAGHGGRYKTWLSLAGDFQVGTAQAPSPSIREQGQAAAIELVRLAMPAARLTTADLAAALGVSDTVVKQLRRGVRPFALGDLIVLQRRLPELFGLLRGALVDSAEGP